MRRTRSRGTKGLRCSSRSSCSAILGNGQFEDVTGQAGAVLQAPEVGRGAAFGDVDNDGDTDVVVANDSGPIQLLVNNLGNRKHWVGLRLVGREPPRPRQALGVRSLTRCPRARHGWRARGYSSRNRSHPLASGQSRWQLRVRQRSESARRPRRLGDHHAKSVSNGPAGRPKSGLMCRPIDTRR